MPTWNDLVSMVRYSDDRATAFLIALMWQFATNHADPGTLGNMLINSVDAYGVANALDFAGLRPNEAVAQAFDRFLNQQPIGPGPGWRPIGYF